jgi:hypothetical protein
VPATRHRFRAEHLTAIVVAALAIFAISAGTSSLPHATPVGTTCAWHGSTLVISGGVINTGMASGQFRTNVRIAIAGRPHPVYRSAFTDLEAFSAGRFTATYRYARKGLAGHAITSCTARVRTIPPPSGED